MPSKLRTFILLSYVSIASVSAAIISPALPQITLDFALAPGKVEWIMSIFLAGYVLGQLIYGPLANRYGRLNALRIGMSINLGGILLCLFAVGQHQYNLLLLGRFINALGAAAGLTCTFILINELFEREQAKQALALAVVSFTVGVGIAVAIGGIITQYWHWWGCLWVLTIHASLMFAFTWLFPETLKEKKLLRIRSLLSGYWQALSSIRLVIFSLVIGFAASLSYCFATAAPMIAQRMLHLTPSQYGYWNLLNTLGMFCSGFLSAALIRRFGTLWVLKFAFVALIPCFASYILMLFSRDISAIWFFATSAMMFLLVSLFFPCGTFYASNAIDDRANASSMMSFINMGSATLAVIGMGALPFSSLQAMVTALATFYAMNVILTSWYLLTHPIE